MRHNFTSGYAFEQDFGYSRAVRVAGHIHVSGTTARGSDLAGDVQSQARAALAIIAAVLREAGSDLGNVVRTVIYVTDLADIDAIAPVHRDSFGAIGPACTIVEVRRLAPAEAKIEIEATAVLAGVAAARPRQTQGA